MQQPNEGNQPQNYAEQNYAVPDPATQNPARLNRATDYPTYPQGYRSLPTGHIPTGPNYMGIVAVVASVFAGPVGLVLGILNWKNARKTGQSATLGIAATFIGASLTVISLVLMAGGLVQFIESINYMIHRVKNT